MRLPRRVNRRILVLVAVPVLLVTATLVVVVHTLTRQEPTRTITPSADAYVSTAHATENYGRQQWLRVDHTPRITSYLRFDLGGSSAPVAKVVLQLPSPSPQVDALQVRTVTDGSWQEDTLTAGNAPQYGAPLDVAADTSNGWTSVDVTALARGQRILNIALTTAGSTPIRFRSRESPSPPRLIVHLGEAPAAEHAPATDLAHIVENVTGATGRRYAVRDDLGASMDVLKIVDNPGGGYLGVYHTTEAGVTVTRVATSTDLLRWTRRAVIDQHSSQPTVAVLADRSVLIAEEADSNGSPDSRTWLRLRHYRMVADLLDARPDRTLDLPHTRVPQVGAEGTPDIRSVVLRPDLGRSVIELGFHYFAQGKVDRPARGILTNFEGWKAWPDNDLAADIEHAGVTGSIGDRDTVVLDHQRFALVEATASAAGGWRVYLTDDGRHDARRLDIRTDGRSTAFANPSVTLTRAPSGARAIVVTLFLPSSGAAPGEGGELVYFTEIGPRPASNDPVVAAAGDIACTVSTQPSPQGDCAQGKTAKVVEDIAPTAVLALGDEQYERGTLDQFIDSYDATWGTFRDITYPVPGNHEYSSPGAAGYYDYFGPAAGDRHQGWYSFDLGAWHVIALNSQCAAVGGCGAGSTQERWLAADLAAHPAACTLAYWHEPRFSSGEHGGNGNMAAFWRDLYAAGADLVLAGHDHDYERFAPQNPDGQPDPKLGIREFVVGTGGKGERPFLAQPAAGSEVRNTGALGVLRLDLHADGYQWRFAPAAGSEFSDSGSGPCH
jgi:hypothetical protein